jgi:hypothetical protein
MLASGQSSAARLTLPVGFLSLWGSGQIRLDTGAMPYAPAPGRPGVELMPLFLDSREDVRLER